jgi:Sec-independent protein translocase protein TatA
MGSFEIVVILLVAFIVLGPKRMTEAARMLGKATGEVRRMTEDLPQMILDEEEPSQIPEWRRNVTASTSRQPATDEPKPPADGPVAFKSGAESASPEPSGEDSGGGEPDTGVGPVAFKSDADPAPTSPSVDETGVARSDRSTPPGRDTK